MRIFGIEIENTSKGEGFQFEYHPVEEKHGLLFKKEGCNFIFSVGGRKTKEGYVVSMTVLFYLPFPPHWDEEDILVEMEEEEADMLSLNESGKGSTIQEAVRDVENKVLDKLMGLVSILVSFAAGNRDIK